MATREGCAHLSAITVYNAPHLMSGTVMTTVKHSQIAMTILDNTKITAITLIKNVSIYYRKFYLSYHMLKNILD